MLLQPRWCWSNYFQNEVILLTAREVLWPRFPTEPDGTNSSPLRARRKARKLPAINRDNQIPGVKRTVCHHMNVKYARDQNYHWVFTRLLPVGRDSSVVWQSWSGLSRRATADRSSQPVLSLMCEITVGSWGHRYQHKPLPSSPFRLRRKWNLRLLSLHIVKAMRGKRCCAAANLIKTKHCVRQKV